MSASQESTLLSSVKIRVIIYRNHRAETYSSFAGVVIKMSVDDINLKNFVADSEDKEDALLKAIF
jgi:hypothetical protein